MKAIGIKQPGGSNQLQLIERDKPKRSKGDLLIKVEAAGVNRTDILTRERDTDTPENVRLGVEVAGTVAESQADSVFKVGDRVMGLVNGGGYSEYAVLPENRAMKIPDTLSFVEGAAIPEVFATAYQTLFWIGRLEENESVLIHAGASGVGTAAIQLAKQLKNAHVIVTAGSQEKLDFCKNLGADVVINYKEDSFDDVVLKETNGRGVDLILDFVGASYWEKNYRSAAVDSRWVLIGTLGGSKIESFEIFSLMQKRIQLTGTGLTPRSDEYKAKLSQELIDRTKSLFESGSIKPIVDTTFTFENVKSAHDYMEADKNIGKIILTL
ncbi:NAD(P)H-quinone oxidoreductase [Jeotgalibaca sp. A127]|uniref:NAD(P)H-quinone oxidoreductase n=1 Tax=Jeotgalibaca sp. A127 TaxID=3457324 RepID=UPI003FD2EA36